MFSNIQTMLNVARIITVLLVLIASAMCEPIEKFEITFGSDFNASSVNINNDNCTCTPFHLCADDPMNTDGAGLMDIRILDESSCPGDFEVCCKSQASDNEPDDDEPSEKLEGCGYQHSKSGFFPWSSALMYRDFRKTSNSYKCGVSLIQESAVITAAHCLMEQGGYYSVRIGREVRNASKIIVHPEYSSATLHNDIALIILNAPIRNAGKSGTICIPPKGTVLDYSDCKSVTWVKQSMKNTTYSYLKMLNLPILPRKTCLNLLRKTVLGPLFKLHYGFVCAGGHAGEDTCGGDGGTPLICPVPGQPHRFHQAGIVSWGIGCSEGQVPGVYTKLSAFRDWIDSEMLTNELDIISYRY